jgi:protein-S-isoprenylcysteine O-methyltransferase Ste14
MYTGFVPFIVGMCLWLGSYAAALLAIVPVGVIAVRILIGERFLRRELEGYGVCGAARYRLIPFMW